jgi:hypothetical protein
MDQPKSHLKLSRIERSGRLPKSGQRCSPQPKGLLGMPRLNRLQELNSLPEDWPHRSDSQSNQLRSIPHSPGIISFPGRSL